MSMFFISEKYLTEQQDFNIYRREFGKCQYLRAPALCNQNKFWSTNSKLVY